MFRTLLVTLALLTACAQGVNAGKECGCQKLYGINASTKEGLRYGFIDCTGKVVVEPKFVAVEEFNDGVAVVRLDRGAVPAPREAGRASEELAEGIVDVQGNLTVPPDTHILSSFSEGLALAKVKGRYAYIDKGGHVAIQLPDGLKISDIDYSPPVEYQFFDGVAALRAEGGGVYVIHRQGGVLFNKGPFRRYDEHGLAVVEVDGKEAIVDRQGNYIFGPQENEISDGDGFYLVAPRAEGEKYKFINLKGEVLYERSFEEVGLFSEGMAKAKANGKWGFIDKSGKLKIPAEFEEARDFADGLAAVKVNDRWGFINHSGTYVIPAQFKFVRDFDCGLVYAEGDRAAGYLDKSGKWVWKGN